VSDALAGQRLGKPTAPAVLSSDVMSSSGGGAHPSVGWEEN